MSKVSRYGFLLALAGCLLLAQPVMAAEGIKGNLVNVNWLEKNFKNADVLILDASSAQTYAAQHIPGAVGVDIYAWYGLQDMPVADMDKLFQSWGISPGKKIVMYDQGGTMLVKAGVPRYAELVCFSDDPGEAAVTYFVLELMGFPDIKVLVI